MGGKAKGNKWESDAAKQFSIWHGQEWKRVPVSGALRWGNVSWTFGDLLPPVGVYACVECKHWHDISIDEMLGTQREGSGGGQIVDWWTDQTVADAERASLEIGRHVEPFLLWKRDRVPPRICMGWPFFLTAELSNKLPFMTVCFDPAKPGFVVVNFKEFLEVLSHDTFTATILALGKSAKENP